MFSDEFIKVYYLQPINIPSKIIALLYTIINNITSATTNDLWWPDANNPKYEMKRNATPILLKIVFIIV